MPIQTLTTPNGSVALLSSRQMLAGQGKMFTVTNPTPGTAVVWATLAAYSATANGLFVIQNGNASGGANIYLDRLWMKQTATAPTGTLSLNFEVYNETGIVTGTGNVATRTPIGLRTSSQSTSAVVQAFSAGAITIPAAAGTRRLQTMFSIPTGVTVAHDSFSVIFGSDAPIAEKNGLTAARATDPMSMAIGADPIVIEPQTTSWINCWWINGGVNVPSLEYKLSFIEL